MLASMKRICLGIGLLAFCLTAQASVDDSAIQIAWGYKGNNGPERWGQLDQKFSVCTLGKTQSPINITKKTIVIPNTLSLHYSPAPMHIMDDGLTQLTIGKQVTILNTGHSIQLNFAGEDKREFLRYEGYQYTLTQFHFHSPSETQLHGSAYPMEIHFVNQGPDGKVVVIGVFIQGGEANPTLQKIIDHLPAHDGKEYAITNVQINPDDLMPAHRDFYSFLGSLTTPPCDEGLQWIVMANPIIASPAQILTLRHAIGGSNARPVQPLNHRTIAYSAENNS